MYHNYQCIAAIEHESSTSIQCLIWRLILVDDKSDDEKLPCAK